MDRPKFSFFIAFLQRRRIFDTSVAGSNPGMEERKFWVVSANVPSGLFESVAFQLVSIGVFCVSAPVRGVVTNCYVTHLALREIPI